MQPKYPNIVGYSDIVGREKVDMKVFVRSSFGHVDYRYADTLVFMVSFSFEIRFAKFSKISEKNKQSLQW